MDKDDRQVGRILSRRDVLKLFGITSATLLAGCVPGVPATMQPTISPATQAPAPTLTDPPGATPAAAVPAPVVPTSLPACVVRPELTEGPYFVDEGLNRSDIRSDPTSGIIKDGAPLTLTFRVSQVGSNGCAALAGAQVDIWHCDAAGLYSDVADPNNDTRGQKFLRGYQETDANGVAVFTTIYPGWYPGRTVHIHFKIRQDTGGQSAEFTSQLFFDDALTDRVFSAQTYAGRGQRNTLNSGDRIYKDQLLLNVTETAAGYDGLFEIGLQAG